MRVLPDLGGHSLTIGRNRILGVIRPERLRNGHKSRASKFLGIIINLLAEWAVVIWHKVISIKSLKTCWELAIEKE